MTGILIREKLDIDMTTTEERRKGRERDQV
jgi:hypothetical protein